MLRLACLLLALVLGSSAVPAQNLLQNPDAEQAIVAGQIPGWTIVSGNWRYRSSSPSPVEGTRYFFAGPGSGTTIGATTELRQDVDVSAFAATIDAGTQPFTFGGYIRALADEARVVVEYRDAGGAVLATFDSGLWTTDTHWELLRDVRTAPAGTRTVRVRLLTTYLEPTNNSGYFDTFTFVADDATPESAFSACGEAWRVIGDPVVGSFGWVASGGNPDGYLTVTDANNNISIYWLAPPAFLGDQSARYGGALRFDRITSLLTRLSDPAYDVSLLGADGVLLTLEMPEETEPGLTWTTAAAPLTEAGWMNDATGLPATQAEFLAVLADLERIYIAAEYTRDSETDGLDNVAFVGGGVYTVTSPAAGDVLIAGTKAVVRWSGPGVPDTGDLVELYLRDAGGTLTLLSSGANTGKLKGLIPVGTPSGSEYTFVVRRQSSPGIFGISAPVIVSNPAEQYTFAEPDPGEYWRRGSTHTMLWSTPGTAPASTVTIELLRGNNVEATYAGEPDDGSFDLVLPASQSTGTTYALRITNDADAAFFGRSARFAVSRLEVVAPAEDETWAAGSSQTVTWLGTANAGGVIKLSLRSATGAYSQSLATSVPYPDGSRAVTVPASASTGAYYVQLLYTYTPPGGEEVRYLSNSNVFAVTNPVGPAPPVARHFASPAPGEGAATTVVAVRGLGDGAEVGVFAPMGDGSPVLLASGVVEAGEAVIAVPSSVVDGESELSFGPAATLTLRSYADGVESAVEARSVRVGEGTALPSVRLAEGEVVTVDVSKGEAAGEVASFALPSVVPNPTSGAASVRFTLGSAQAVTVAVYDVLGREVAVLFEGTAAAGAHAVPLPPGLPAGVYVARVSGDGGQAASRFTVTR